MMIVGLLGLCYVAFCIYRGNLLWELGISRRSENPYFFWAGISIYSVVSLLIFYAGYVTT